MQSYGPHRPLKTQNITAKTKAIKCKNINPIYCKITWRITLCTLYNAFEKNPRSRLYHRKFLLQLSGCHIRMEGESTLMYVYIYTWIRTDSASARWRCRQSWAPGVNVSKRRKRESERERKGLYVYTREYRTNILVIFISRAAKARIHSRSKCQCHRS